MKSNKNDDVKNVANMQDTVNITGNKTVSAPKVTGGVANIRLKGEQAKNFSGTGKRLLNYLRPYRLKLIAAVLMTVLASAFGIISPKMLGQITSQLQLSVQNGTAFDFFWAAKLMLVLVAIYLMTLGADYFRQYIMVGLTQNIIYDLRSQVDRKIGMLPLKYIDSNNTGDIMSRATNDIDNIATALQTSLAECISALVTIIGVVIIMLTTDVLITLICVITIPLGTLITMAIVRSSQKYFSRQATLLGQINGKVEECFSGHKIIKAFGREKSNEKCVDQICREYKDAASRAQFASGFTYPLTSFVSELAFVGICLVGGLRVLSGKILLGDVQALIQYSQKVSNPVTQVTNMISILQTTVASAERVFELLDEPEERVNEQCKLPRKIQGTVEFKDVCFSYSPDKPLIENFNLLVKPGQTAAIVGHTGAGKTTLVNLIMGFYRPVSGKITIDSVDINTISPQSLREHIAMVLQDTWLFDGTIAENIAYGAPEPEKVTRQQIVQAAQTAMADSFIRALPQGYDTVLSEATGNISQGQRQLLTIARAVMAQPDILILDEATSSVDTRTEQLIQSAMEHLMQGRTCFIIAHRLSTIRSAQLIIVMDNGRIAEMGTHKQLLEQKGVYSQLYSSQN